MDNVLTGGLLSFISLTMTSKQAGTGYVQYVLCSIQMIILHSLKTRMIHILKLQLDHAGLLIKQGSTDKIEIFTFPTNSSTNSIMHYSMSHFNLENVFFRLTTRGVNSI